MDLNDIKKAVNRGNFSTSELQSLISYTRTVMETQTKAVQTLNLDGVKPNKEKNCYECPNMNQ